MTTKDDFTADEWVRISELPGRVLASVAIADGKNPIKIVKEMSAGSSTLTQQIAQFPSNAIIASFAESGSFNAPADVKTTDEAVDALLAGVGEAFAVLRAKASAAEVDEVGQMLVATATAVANAAGSGMFGGGADKVDAREQSVLDRLAAIVAGTA